MVSYTRLGTRQVFFLRDGVLHCDMKLSIPSTESLKIFFASPPARAAKAKTMVVALATRNPANGLTNIQRSIKLLTAKAEENHIPDVLVLLVDFVSKVHHNMTEAPSVGP